MPESPPNKKLAILLSMVSPEQPDFCVMPFVYAAVAAAMENEVEVYFTGPGIRLLVAGVASGLRSGKDDNKTIYDHMQEAARHGARFIGCSLALKQRVSAEESMVAEFSSAAGAATIVMRSLDPEWRVLCF